MKLEKTLLLISGNRFADPYPVYPIAISYLESYLAQNLPGFRIVTFDCNLDSVSSLSDAIAENKPSYIGLSLRNIDGANSLGDDDFISGYREIVKIIRAATNAPLILGGAGFSIFPNELMNILQADFGIAGEGEESLRQLISALENRTPTAGIEGLITSGSQPIPHRNYLQMLNICFDGRFVDFYWKHSGMINIQTKRGCPFQCIYCSYPHIDGRKVRTLDPRLIVENMTRLNKEKGVNYFFFTDSVFNIHDNFNAQLAEELIKSDIKISWGAYFSPKNIRDEQIALYRKSGLTHVEFGTESFSDTVLDCYEKGFTMREVFNASAICLKHNVYYAHFLILGGYGETSETLAETFANSRKIEYSVFFPFIGMRIYPHTRLQQIAINEGIISPNDNLLLPKYYLSKSLNLERVKKMAEETGKAWIFPDDPKNNLMMEFRLKRNKKGLLWEYLRKP